MFEAQFGDSRYEILWRERVGFAKVALKTRAKVIPMFTQNIRETFRTVGFLRRMLKVRKSNRYRVGTLEFKSLNNDKFVQCMTL